MKLTEQVRLGYTYAIAGASVKLALNIDLLQNLFPTSMESFLTVSAWVWIPLTCTLFVRGLKFIGNLIGKGIFAKRLAEKELEVINMQVADPEKGEENEKVD